MKKVLYFILLTAELFVDVLFMMALANSSWNCFVYADSTNSFCYYVCCCSRLVCYRIFQLRS